jgi:hypothetical protein
MSEFTELPVTEHRIKTHFRIRKVQVIRAVLKVVKFAQLKFCCRIFKINIV